MKTYIFVNKVYFRQLGKFITQEYSTKANSIDEAAEKLHQHCFNASKEEIREYLNQAYINDNMEFERMRGN